MRILLIEDDHVVADFVEKGMKEAGHTVLHARDGIEGLDCALNTTFDVAIADLMLPKLDGLSIIQRMRENRIQVPVLILSAKRSIDDRVLGLRQGGDDYLTKPFAFAELLARAEALFRRSGHTGTSSTLEYDELVMDLLAHTVVRANQRIDLQPKEFMLLAYLLRNAGHVVSKTMIMERVWNFHFDPCTNVVEARISKLREKIDKPFTHTLIHTVRGAGYVLKRNGPGA